MGAHAIVVKPEDLLLVGIDLGKAIGYMLSPTPENVLGYIEKIETEFIEPGNWPFTYDKYSRKFGGAWVGLTHNEKEAEEKEFKKHLATCTPITAKSMGELMNVQPNTARSYLNDLSDKKILYVRKTKGQENIYYPVSDFNTAKAEISAKYPKPEELVKSRDELQEIYGKYIKRMESMGFEKVDEPVIAGESQDDPDKPKVVESKPEIEGIENIKLSEDAE